VPRLSHYVTRSRPFRRTARVLDKVVLPGFEGASLYEFGKTLLKEIRVNKLDVRGAAVTYNFLMAIPPALLFFCSLVPYLPMKGVQESILTILRIVSPNEATYISFQTVIVDFLTNERKDILSFGILTAFYFSSNGIMGLMKTFDRTLPVYVRRSGFRRRWTAIRLTFVVLIVTLFTITALILQTEYINDLIERYTGLGALVKVFSMGIIVLMIFFMMCVVYTYGPSLSERFPFFSPGAVIATIMCVILSGVFFFLVKNVIHYNKVYGSIGTLMAFMVWLYLNIQVILLGYEINVSILLCRLNRTRDLPTAEQAELFSS
jgi:membrane protein